MNKATLAFLLRFAGWDGPIQGQYFHENPNICFEELLTKKYLNTATLPNELFVLIDGERHRVFETEFNGLTRYWYIDEDESVDIDAKWVDFYTLNYTPFAELLSKTYHCDVQIEEHVSNCLWYLGIPEAGTTEIYLARNPGTNPAVENVLDNLEEGSMVLWFGTMPIRKTRKAKLYRLSDYILVDGKVLRHKDQWPPAINESAVAIQIRSDYAFIIKDDFCEIWFQGSGPIKIDAVDGVFYIARILQAKGERLTPLTVAPPETCPDALPYNPEEIESFEQERPIEVYSKGDLKRIRKENDVVKEQAEAEFEKGNIDKGNELMGDYQDTLARISSSTRPGGRSIQASDPMANVKTIIRKARNRVCAKLRDNGHEELAIHFEQYIKIGNDCYYAPDKPIIWQVHIPRVHK